MLNAGTLRESSLIAQCGMFIEKLKDVLIA